MLGLSFYSAEQRSKEIGIRKIMGASVLNIFTKFSSEYLVMIIISSIVAIPVSYILINKWLNKFPIKVGLDPLIFIYSAIILTMITITTVGFQIYKTAKANPIDALQYE